MNFSFFSEYSLGFEKKKQQKINIIIEEKIKNFSLKQQ